MVEMEEERLRMREHVMNEVCNYIYIYIYMMLTHIKRAPSSISLTLSK